MKHLAPLVLAFTLSACGQPPVVNSNPPTMPATTQTPSPSTPSPQPSPTPSAAPSPIPSSSPTCKDFSTSTWTNISTGEIDTITSGLFLITDGSDTCSRAISQAQVYNSPTSYLWPVAQANTPCAGVSRWIQFDTSVCNQLTALIRDSQGAILETDVFN